LKKTFYFLGNNYFKAKEFKKTDALKMNSFVRFQGYKFE